MDKVVPGINRFDMAVGEADDEGTLFIHVQGKAVADLVSPDQGE